MGSENRRSKVVGGVLVSILAASCGDSLEERSREISQGDLRIGPQTTEACPVLSLQEGASLTVTLGGCEACGAVESRPSCSVVLDGGTLRVAMTVDEVIDTSLESCVDMCRTLEATCTTPALPAGEYTVVWGGVRLPIEIPSETAAVRYPEYCCDDDDDCRPGATCDLDTHRCPSLGP